MSISKKSDDFAAARLHARAPTQLHAQLHIGTAGWTIPRHSRPAFTSEGTHLERYAKRLSASEINSSFYRPHKPTTYLRWAESVPPGFLFSVKIPKVISHELRLENAFTPLDNFLFEAQHLGDRLGCLLLQLPPSFAFDERVAHAFFTGTRERYSGAIALEARHATWFAHDAERVLSPFGIAYVQADPELFTIAESTAGTSSIAYFRLHGSPRVYYSSYSGDALQEVAQRIAVAQRSSKNVWCIFDNTASGAAMPNALELSDLLAIGTPLGDSAEHAI